MYLEGGAHGTDMYKLGNGIGSGRKVGNGKGKLVGGGRGGANRKAALSLFSASMVMRLCVAPCAISQYRTLSKKLAGQARGAAML